jgi:nucleoside-diphosphate-sugar epimerase
VAAGPRVIVAGSLEQPIVRADGTLAAPSSPYAASKHAAAAYAQMFCDLFDVPTVVARIFMVYGPGQTDLRKLVPYVTLSLLRDRAPKLSSGGRAVDWVYVDDVVASLLRMATAPGAVGRTIDVGSGVLTPVASVARSLGRLINTSTEPVFGEVPDRPGEQVRVADVAGAAEALGGDSTVTPLDDGLRRTIAWYADRLHSGTIDPATLP